jgi:hypothetical protein
LDSPKAVSVLLQRIRNNGELDSDDESGYANSAAANLGNTKGDFDSLVDMIVDVLNEGQEEFGEQMFFSRNVVIVLVSLA